ncbi:iron-siderophore ABC transporter substrate-binding protein [Vibrio sp. SCSIO 43132]|uniref:iron-siderophore ABC transporter substrate-binding protein n=1 Tax=Vibrio sp. SCSIO 43132 TaxID=2779363 RepID=UPI001CA85DD1|nr:iron-siderophore ABC transporter substrate-binding protein [Vibrio sp. SCSIO 43132]UAB71350.1 iron-siderophore ABC transporter substrate-binding protein [Vibrio sp. SCSIO 43132]
MLRNALIALLFFTVQVSAEIKVQDSRGERTLPEVPVRVAALNWDIAEQVLELGVTPVAMPDISEYNNWVVKPAVPESVEDIGTRMEPNMARLEQLKPDVIIIGSPQVDLTERLEKIAPVLYYHTYKQEPGNVERSIKHFHQMGHALGKADVAKQKVEAMYTKIEAMKAKLDKHYPETKPKVAAFRFASTTTIYLYGDNSSTQEALSLLGFEMALPQPSTQWGVTQKRVKELYGIGDGLALYFKPFNQEAELEKSVMWNAMPFVKNNKVHSVEPVWNYGGAMSLLHVADALTNSLLELAPDSGE